jgi:hypothetical protein
MTYRQRIAIKNANKKKILEILPRCPERSGIYFFIREEDGFKYAYIGQAKRLLTRLAGHLKGYQHIDLSIKKHGLFSADNPTGWEINFLEFPESQLNEKEQHYIKAYANGGWQVYNHTSGSQGEGKKALDNQKATKGYLQGLANGYMNARKDIAHLFKLHLDYTTKRENPTVNQQKALQKFEDFLDWENKE